MRAVVLLAVCFFAASWGSAAEQAHAIRQGTQGLAFHYGLVPAEVVLAREARVSFAERDRC